MQNGCGGGEGVSGAWNLVEVIFQEISLLSTYHVERKETEERHDEPLLRFFLIELKFDRSSAVQPGFIPASTPE